MRGRLTHTIRDSYPNLGRVSIRSRSSSSVLTYELRNRSGGSSTGRFRLARLVSRGVCNRARVIICSKMLRATTSLLLTYVLLLQPIAAAANGDGKFALTIDNLMRGPSLVGTEPAQVRWSG